MFRIMETARLILILSLSISTSLAKDPQRSSDQNVGIPCSAHRIWVWRPILDRFAKVNSSEELKNQVQGMSETIKELQTRIGHKDELLLLQAGQIKDQSARLNVLAKNMKVLRSEWLSAQDEIKNKDIQIQLGAAKIKHLSDELLSQCSRQDTCPTDGKGGIYKLKIRGLAAFEAPCSSNGWLTIQKRYDGSENFDRGWKDYKDGFGRVRGEFFIGLEKVHHMTRQRSHELYIKLGKIDGTTSHAHYDDFELGGESESYELKSLGRYNGTAGDSLRPHERKKFTTNDRDNDAYRFNCAADEYGGWWYYDCAKSMLNGKFYKEGRSRNGKTNGIMWGSWHNNDWTYSLTFVEMMIRPRIN
ncbi:fibrinogen-like protein 1 [Drosophila sechellia]|uniref:GM22864 n=1 Tax=Drosophila sechellia TaxID=7238 RepID=B4I6L2_DROSE|nr:fibrinogen-like protein 1 [Drosophila sechellia]EDW55960.1 GM22864 [Drosophila sechellia]